MLYEFHRKTKEILLKSFLFVNGIKIYQFKAKYSELNEHPPCLCNIPNDFAVDKKKELEHMDIFMILQSIIIK